MLMSKQKIENGDVHGIHLLHNWKWQTSYLDPTVPEFRKWLLHLGASEYTDRFLHAGYDLAFIAKSKTEITAEALDVIGIPREKLGIRSKIMERYEIEKFYPLKTQTEKKSPRGSARGEGADDDDAEEDGSDDDEDEEDNEA